MVNQPVISDNSYKNGIVAKPPPNANRPIFAYWKYNLNNKFIIGDGIVWL